MLLTCCRFISDLNERIGRLLAWFLPAMTAATLAIIFCASALRVGWVWLGESVVYMHAMLFMLGAAYTLRHDEHVCIDVFYAKLPPRAQAWVYLLGVFLLLLPVCGVIFATSLPYVMDSWAVREHSPEGQGLPFVYLLKTCLLLMPLLVGLQGLAIAADSYLVIRGRKKPRAAGDASEASAAAREV